MERASVRSLRVEAGGMRRYALEMKRVNERKRKEQLEKKENSL